MDLILQVEDGKLWSPGKRKIMNLEQTPLTFRDELLRHFTKYMAGVYADELVRAIEEQRYGDVWTPLSPHYLLLKERMGWSDKIWEATGKLKASIDWWRSPDKKGYVVGVSPKKYYRAANGDHILVRDVALWMEYGTGEQAEGGKGKTGWPGMPARPLFRPLRDYLSKHIDDFYRKFLYAYEDDIDDLLVITMAGAL